MDEVKACPFCGGKATVDDGAEGHFLATVTCKTCGAFMPGSIVTAAIRQWNRREPVTQEGEP
jgi:Lar family restriction alleviation protein|tara:strand:+ start:2111 stop:2296 length:186 start_codon:yes stop_codon:yes gene_type:complete